MGNEKKLLPFGETDIQSRIKTIGGIQVMLDCDLALLYGVETKQLKRQVRRNIKRFPLDFMIELNENELEGLRCQIGTSNRGGDRYGAYAFTEQGIAMLSSVLKSERAITVNIGIMRAFVRYRNGLEVESGLAKRVEEIARLQILDRQHNDDRFEKIFNALDRGNLLPSGIFPAGSEFDAMRFVVRLIENAQSTIVLIDPYADAVTLEVLAKKHPGVKVRLVCKDRGQPSATEVVKFNRQYKDLVVDYSDGFHDRFLIIDNTELHNLGSSVNSLGRRVTAYSTRDTNEISKLMSMVNKMTRQTTDCAPSAR